MFVFPAVRIPLPGPFDAGAPAWDLLRCNGYGLRSPVRLDPSAAGPGAGDTPSAVRYPLRRNRFRPVLRGAYESYA